MPLPRRTFLAGAALLTAACAAPTPATGRTADSVHGPITVPERAERVVCLDLSKIQRMLDVGVTPVGVVEGWQPLDAHTDWYTGAAKVGSQAAPNIEAIAAVGPDLILASPQGVDDALFGRLSALAPTVVLAARGLGAEWKALSAADARAAGRETELTAVADRYTDRVSELRGRVGDRGWGAMYGIPNGAYSLLPECGPGVVLTDLGARFVDPAPGIYQQVSYEELSRFATADVLLVDAQAGGSLTGATTALLAAPTFAALPARVAPLSHLLVFSYGEALALLDQLEGVL